MKKVLIIGATSGIASACAREFGSRGDHLVLLARNEERLTVVEDDLKARGASVVGRELFDARDLEGHKGLVKKLWNEHGGFDIALVAHGMLGEQETAEQDVSHAQDIILLNYTSAVSLITHLSAAFEAQGHGSIAVITSVAGDRGRASNYVYGSAKGGLSIFLSGLRQRLHAKGVSVIDVRPGFTDTPMTQGLKKGALMSSAETVARGIVRALDRSKPVAYVPWFWFWIMGIIKSIPERLFVHVKI